MTLQAVELHLVPQNTLVLNIDSIQSTQDKNKVKDIGFISNNLCFMPPYQLCSTDCTAK